MLDQDFEYRRLQLMIHYSGFLHCLSRSYNDPRTDSTPIITSLQSPSTLAEQNRRAFDSDMTLVLCQSLCSFFYALRRLGNVLNARSALVDGDRGEAVAVDDDFGPELITIRMLWTSKELLR